MRIKAIRAKDLLKTSGILRASPEETIRKSLAKLSHSHDAVFVFDKKDIFLGVISPYYVIFRKYFPADTKVKHVLFNPPCLSLETYIWDIAKAMLESKVYYLPVVDEKNNFIGIVSANRILQLIKDEKDFITKLKLKTTKNLVTISSKASLSKAHSLFREKRISRLPIVNHQGALKGIVTHFDIRQALAEPKQKPRWLSREGEKNKFFNRPLEGYYKKMVVTSSQGALVSEIIGKMLEKNIGSVVIVDSWQKPVDIISKHDLLKAIDQVRFLTTSEIILKVGKNFDQKEKLETLLSQYIAKMNKFSPIKRVEYILEGRKNPAGKVNCFQTSLHIFLVNGKELTARSTDYDWKKATKEMFMKVRRQIS